LCYIKFVDAILIVNKRSDVKENGHLKYDNHTSLMYSTVKIIL